MSSKSHVKLVSLAPWIYKRANFYFRDHPAYHPDTQIYMDYWEEQERRSVEGIWILNQADGTDVNGYGTQVYDPSKPGGYTWLSPQHYWYLMFCLIKADDEGSVEAKHPDLRDIDKYLFNVYTCCWGFSGMSDDKEITCNHLVKKFLKNKESIDSFTPKERMRWVKLQASGEIHKVDGTLKKYIEPLKYLQSNHKAPKGNPLYSNTKENMMLMTSRRLGKMLPSDCPILTTEGWVRMEDLTENHTVYGSDGKEARITFKTELQNNLSMYRITLKDGREIECCEDHLWKVFDKNVNRNLKNKTEVKYSVFNTKTLYNRYKIKRKNQHWKSENEKSKEYIYESICAIPNNECIHYTKKDLDIDPYFLGLWLGDGHSHKIAITTEDQEIKQYVTKYIENNGLKVNIQRKQTNSNVIELHSANNSYYGNNVNQYTKSGTLIKKYVSVKQAQDETGIRISDICASATGKQISAGNYIWKYTGCKTSPNVLTDKFKSLNLLHSKHIPNIYLRSSEEQRLELLRGLLDTDGTVGKTSIEFYNKNKQLIDDFTELARSLGIGCKVKLKKSKIKDKEYFGNYRVTLFTDKDIFKLSRKKEIHTKNLKLKTKSGRSKFSKSFIENIVKLEKPGSGYCIGVDNYDNTYITKDYIVTHNSYFNSGILSQRYNFHHKDTYKDFLNTKLGPNILVGSAASSKSGELLNKFKFSQDNLVENFGAYMDDDGNFIAGFFSKTYQGTLNISNEKNPYRYTYKHKKGNTWTNGGTRTSIVHGSYETNSQVFVGQLSPLGIEDEVGINSKLRECLKHDEPIYTLKEKEGIAIKAGTGGEMKYAFESKVVFYDPKTYKFFSVKNEWENPTQDIGIFIPAVYTDNSFRDSNGNQNIQLAYEQELIERKRLSESNNTSALDGYITNRPLIPSEIFLSPEINTFPIHLIKEHIQDLEDNKTFELIASVGHLTYTDPNKTQVKWTNYKDPRNKPILTWDFKQHEGNLQGSIVVYEHPPSVIPNPSFGSSMYKIGYDPVNDDFGGTSLGSIIVFKSESLDDWNKGVKNTIVATYHGRYDSVDDMHDIAIKLALYYNAKILPETNLPDFIRYAKRRGLYGRLQLTPYDAVSTLISGNRSNKMDVGMRIMKSEKLQGEQLIRQFLLEERGVDPITGKKVLNLHHIYDPKLLDEFLIYTRDNNTDAISAFILIMFWVYQERMVPIKDPEKVAQTNTAFDQYYKDKIQNSFSNKQQLIASMITGI